MSKRIGQAVGRVAARSLLARSQICDLAAARAAIPLGRDAALFTPGPLTTSHTIKQAMLTDLGSRDVTLAGIVQDIRNRLLEIAGVSVEDGYECVLQQGSGTFSVESVVSTVVPPPSEGGRMLIVSNGSYGIRMGKMCKYHGIDHELIRYDESTVPVVGDVIDKLRNNGGRRYTHVGIIHHETSAGIVNPMQEIGQAVHKFDPDISYVVDAMSSFGAYPVDMKAAHAHYLVSSPNKNLEGVPGFGFIICRRERLEREGVSARSLSLDLLDQWKEMDGVGDFNFPPQFRFTPPTHSLLAFHQALKEHADEGGPAGRLARYEANHRVLKKGMAKLGFQPLVAEEHQGAIITTFLCPSDDFDFPAMYSALRDRGFVIYPGKLGKTSCFRIGTIGRLFPRDMANLVSAIKEVLGEMEVPLPVGDVEVPAVPAGGLGGRSAAPRPAGPAA